MPSTILTVVAIIIVVAMYMSIHVWLSSVKPGSQYDAGASVKSAEHNQRRIVNEFYVGTLGALTA